MIFDTVEPILGFEQYKKFNLQKIDETFMRLQSVESDEPSFTLINPFTLRSYAFDIPSPLQERLGIDESSNLLVFNIMMIQNPIENSTINFAAPLVFNTDTKKMAQVIISDNPDYGLTEPIKKYLGKNDA